MEGGGVARGGDPSDGGVSTESARRPRLAAATAALLLAAGLGAYALARGGGPTGLVALAAGAGVALVLAALLGAWEDGLAAGPGLLLLAYTVSLTQRSEPLDRGAALVAVGLVALVELGSWSLELRDGAEERPLARLPRLVLLLAGALAASGLVLAVGSVRSGAGIAFFLVGAAAAAGLLALIAPPAHGLLRKRAD